MVDISKDVQYYLQHHPAIEALIASKAIGSDEAWVNGWIFDSNLQVRMENTQQCALVVNYAGGWSSPLEGNLAHFPMVVVDIWSDPTRKEDNSPKFDDAKTKAFDVFDAVFSALHLAHHETDDGQVIYFNQTRVTSCELIGEPLLSPVANGNGAKMLRCNFGISYY